MFNLNLYNLSILKTKFSDKVLCGNNRIWIAKCISEIIII